MKEYPLEEFFGAIAGVHEAIMEEQDLPADTPLTKHDFQHLILEALDVMCDCEHDEEPGPPADWELAMMTLFGNTEDVIISTISNGITNIYEATHKDGKTVKLECPHSQVSTGEDQSKQLIKLLERLHKDLNPA